MTTQIDIRPARHADIPAIQHVARTTWRATYAGQIADPDIEQFLDSAYSQRSVAISINRLREGFGVAVAGGELVGYAMAGRNRDGAPELHALYVLPAWHGSGAGQRLWDAALVVLADQGHARMCCWVLESNLRARRFYERQGAILIELREIQIGATTVTEARYCVATCPVGQASGD